MNDVSSAFALWAEALEESVDCAIQAAHVADPVAQPHARLPKAAKGRCQHRQRVPTAHPHVSSRARAGGYDPVCEAMTMSSRRKVKQVRRVHALWQGCCTLHRRAREQGTFCPRLTKQLRAEWDVIRKNKAFGPRFDSWLLGYEMFGQVWLDLPPPDWLRDVLQVARHACDAQVRSEAALRKQRFRYLVQMDTLFAGQKQGFSQLRPKPRPPISCLPVTEEREAVRVGEASGGTALYEVNHPQFLRPHCSVFSTAGPAMLLEVLPETQGERADWVKLSFDSGRAPPSCRITQKTQAVTCEELHREFVEYWASIWWRDSRAESTEIGCWPAFLERLPPRPPEAGEVVLSLMEVSVWEDALRRLRPHRATGYDGFSPAELKGLTGRMLEDMIYLFDQVVQLGFPTHLARSRVHVLSKTDCPQSFSDGRPITIYSTMYRLWTSLIARSILQQWSAWMPVEVAGGMPHRCSSDIAFEIQCSVEAALLRHQPLGGFSLDISKCFNQIPRPPISCLLKHLGVPPNIVDRWIQILTVSERTPVFQGAMGASMGASTGTPEGDALSVVAMCAICWMLLECNRHTGSRLLTFVDNFSWLAAQKSSLRCGLSTAQTVCAALSLPIDWRKSFCWGTTPSMRRFWDVEVAALLLPGVALRRAAEAMDLGVGFCFQAKKLRGKADLRFQEGKHRLDRLRRQPRPLASKVRLLLGGIWPQCLFGMHGRLIPQAMLSQLRSKAAKALCHAGPSQSPFLVLSAVAPAITDPEVFLMIQSAVAVRRLFQTAAPRAHTFLQDVTAHEPGRPVLGPATAFAAMLHRSDWEVKPDGWCCGPGMYTFSVKHSSRRQISRAVQAAWTHNLGAKLAHRNGLHAVGAISGSDTMTVVQALPASRHNFAANCVAGGHMSASSRAKWDALVEPQCVHCGAQDTKFHRVFECPLFSSIRQAFAPLLSWIQQHALHWIHSSCITEHPDADVVRLLFRTRPYVDPPPLLSPPQTAGRVMYTDGSCTVPQVPAARHASWAVVEDVALHLNTHDLLAFFRYHNKILQNFHVVAQGLVPREQTIGRAEIIAVLQVCRLASREPHVPYHVHVDSTYARKFVECLDAPLLQGVGPTTDLDLCQWANVWRKPPNLFCHKVKSHSCFDSLDVCTARHALGNAMADAAAKNARQCDMPFVYPLLESIDARQQTHRDMLRGYLQYQHQCARAVIAARTRSDELDDVSMQTGGARSGALAEWHALTPTVLQVVAYPDLQTTWLEAAPWPPWFVARVWSWSTQLRWPVDAPMSKDLAGVSILELLADFIATTGTAPPLVGARSGTAEVPVQTELGRTAAFSFKDLVITLSAAIRYLEKISGTKLLLAKPNRRVPCLKVLGCHASRRGFTPRPKLVNQGTSGLLLEQMLAADNQSETIRALVTSRLDDEYGLHSEFHERWTSLTEHQKIRMRNKLWARRPGLEADD